MGTENICENPQQFPPGRSLHVSSICKGQTIAEQFQSISFPFRFSVCSKTSYLLLSHVNAPLSHDDNISILSSHGEQKFAKY